jgi:hypothetical protein
VYKEKKVEKRKGKNKKGIFNANQPQPKEREGSSLTSKNAQNATKAIHAMPTQRAAVSNKPQWKKKWTKKER